MSMFLKQIVQRLYNLHCCKRRDRVRQSAIKVACFLSLILWLVMIYLGFLGSPLIAEIQLPCMDPRRGC